MSRTDEAGGEADRAAASPSRSRVAGHGWVPWAGGVAVAGAQVLVLVVGHGFWRTGAVAGLVVVTLGAVGFALFGGEDRPGV